MDANPFIEAYNTSKKAQYDQLYFQQHVRILGPITTLALSFLDVAVTLLQAWQDLQQLTKARPIL